MEGRSVKVTMDGAALGEIVSEGVILDEQNQTLATFRQRFRAWLGRPMLDVRIEIEPVACPRRLSLARVLWGALRLARRERRPDARRRTAFPTRPIMPGRCLPIFSKSGPASKTRLFFPADCRSISDMAREWSM